MPTIATASGPAWWRFAHYLKIGLRRFPETSSWTCRNGLGRRLRDTTGQPCSSCSCITSFCAVGFGSAFIPIFLASRRIPTFW